MKHACFRGMVSLWDFSYFYAQQSHCKITSKHRPSCGKIRVARFELWSNHTLISNLNLSATYIVIFLSGIRGCLFRLLLAFHWKTKRGSFALGFAESTRRNRHMRKGTFRGASRGFVLASKMFSVIGHVVRRELQSNATVCLCVHLSPHTNLFPRIPSSQPV
jgi:hypothetical protein